MHRTTCMPCRILKCFFHNANNSTRKFSSHEIRRIFLEYFAKDHNHTFVPSRSVLPASDKSILFTNAGMNQFKPIFLGNLDKDSPFKNLQRAVNYQKCIRVGGKHNDLDDVGKDLYHHTFFEMLGNWSFGDYFKAEACAMALELLTKVYKLPKDKLYFTYFGGDIEQGLLPDDEVRHTWLQLGVPSSHILPFGMKDNFWEMDEVGPCGPSTEIHIDLAAEDCSIPANQRVNAGQGDMVELWNLVFIQMNRDINRNLSTLPQKHVDTGMGMERLTAILQNKVSNYDTDLFSPILASLQKQAKVRPYRGFIGRQDADCIDMAYRIVADHARMFTIAISDGILPDHVDAGNKLRRIIRKASHIALRHLSCDRGVLATLTDQVEAILGDVYPGINVSLVKDVVNSEEEKYLQQMEKADAAIRNIDSGKLPGHVAAVLYQQYGLHKELIADIAAEKRFTVDWDGFEEHLKEFQEKSKAGQSPSLPRNNQVTKLVERLLHLGIPPTNTSPVHQYTRSNGSYDFPNMSTVIEAVFCGGQEVMSVSALKEECCIVTRDTNFYYESGGQASDKGHIITKNGTVKIDDVEMCSGFVFHRGVVLKGTVNRQEDAELCTDQKHRYACMIHHTATHCLNAALRQVVESTKQMSSQVDSKHLRFDFLSKSSLTNSQAEKIEELCTDIINRGLPVQRRLYPKAEALHLPGLVTLPDEVYPNVITVITIGTDEEAVSREPCCGTHVFNTGDLNRIVLTSHRSLGATVKSVSAVAGHLADDVENNDEFVKNEMKQLVQEISDLQKAHEHRYIDLITTKKRVPFIRKLLSGTLVSLLLQRDAEPKVEKLERQIDSLIRKYNKTVAEAAISRELDEALEMSKNSPFLVMSMRTPWHGRLVSRLVNKLCCHKPCFVITQISGSELQVDCIAPKEMANGALQANKWAEVCTSYVTVLSQTSNKFNTPETFWKMTASFEEQKIEDLLCAASNYARKYLCEDMANVRRHLGE